MSEQVLCKDCKHSFRTVANILTHGFNNEYAYQCRKSFKETHTQPNPVIGSKTIQSKYETCGIARIGRVDRDDRCGESGQWWEPKNKRDLFKFIKHVSV